MVTYWLIKRTDGEDAEDIEHDSDGESPKPDNDSANEELPGEITTVEDPLYSASLNYPMPGRHTKCSTKDEIKNTARVAPVMSEKGRKNQLVRKKDDESDDDCDDDDEDDDDKRNDKD